MQSLEDRVRLADEVLAFASALAIPRLERVLSPGPSVGLFA